MLENLALPVVLETGWGAVALRRAVVDDVEALMALLSDDPVSASGGDRSSAADRPTYQLALEQIIDDPSNDIVIALDGRGHAVGTMQVTRIPGMARRGATRLLIEAVRVRSDARSSGIGTAMMRWGIDVAAPTLSASLVQLTSDAARVDAHRFYERLGFVASHVGFKYHTSSGLSALPKDLSS